MNEVPGKGPTEILVSIIIATFNAEEHIRACLESILQQPEKNIEIVIVDGGSTDKTITVVKEFDAPNIIWKSEPDEGIYDATNKGTKIARGKWFYFLGSDDRLLPGFSEMASKLKDENAIYYGNTEPWYYGDNRPSYELLNGRFTNYRLAKYCINHQAVIYPAKVFKKYHYDIRYKVFADYALNIQLWGDADFQKIFYPVDIARYNMTGFSSTVIDEQFKKDKARLVKESMGWFTYLRFLFKRFKKKLRGENDI